VWKGGGGGEWGKCPRFVVSVWFRDFYLQACQRLVIANGLVIRVESLGFRVYDVVLGFGIHIFTCKCVRDWSSQRI